MVQGNILLGILLATGILYFFINSARATLLITLTVPISLLLAFIALDVLKLTLNVISLAGLAFAVGLVMDAAIVVQENIFRLRQAGMNLPGAIAEGCQQVSGALFSSTLTTVAIFVPVLFTVGVEGQLFKDLAVTISVAVLASLISALTVLPVITSQWVGGAVSKDRFVSYWRILASFVVKMTRTPALRWGWIGSLLIGSAISIWALTPKIDFLPRANIDAIIVYFNLPPGVNVKTIREELAPDVVARLQPYYTGEQEPKIRAYNFASFNGFFTQVYIYPENADEVDDLVNKLRSEVLVGIPGVSAFVNQSSMLNVDGGGGRNISVDIQGNDLEQLLTAARQGQEVIRGLWENTNVFARGGLSLNEPELLIVPNDRRISTSGLDRAAVGRTIRAYTGGLFAGEYFDGRRTVTLNVTPPPEVTLEEAIEKLQAEATPVIKGLLPPTASIKYRGNADRLKQALVEVRKNFGIAITILFMIMAALFRSVIDSLIVLLVMPVSVAGGLLGLKLVNLVTFQSLDMLTMIGFIILLGLDVNNAILLVDQTRKAEREGLSSADAVLQAVQYRARPIFMSTLTSLFGMLPLMLIPGVGSEIYRGLATVIVGGMLVSSIFTLILLPSLLQVKVPAFAFGGRFQSAQMRESS